MKSKLSAILVILMIFMFSGCFSVYAENDEVSESSESVAIEENPIIPVVPDMPANSENINNSDNKLNTLTIECRDNDTVLSQMSWSIYKVADISPDNSFIKTDDFAGYNVEINNLTTSETVSAAETLEAYAHVDGLKPLETAITADDGILEFEGLSYGLYLLSGTAVTIDDNYYLPTPSLVTLDGGEVETSNWSYNVTSQPKLAVLGVNDRIYHFAATVKKVWENDNEDMRPESITVILARNGNEFSSVILSEANDWTYTWDHLSSRYNWTVIEEDSFEDYTVSYSENKVNINPDNPNEYDVEFVIVNTGNLVITQPPVAMNSVKTTVTTVTTTAKSMVAAPPVEKQVAEKSKTLPQTGQLWWPVPAFSASGLLIFALGWKLNSNKRKNDEK